MDDDRREHLLAHAKAAATLPEPFCRRAILDIIFERLRPATLEAAFRGEFLDPGPIDDLILAAYPAIDRFWRAWLHDPLSPNELIHLLATTAVPGVIEYQQCSNLLNAVVTRYPGDIATDPAATVVRWLAVHPDAEELLSPLVTAYLNRTSDQGAESGPELRLTRNAAIINRAITAVYDDAEVNGTKPPNINEIVKPVQELLAKDGRTATGVRIKGLAEKEPHARRRLKSGGNFIKDL